jgi:hypothetical protein
MLWPFGVIILVYIVASGTLWFCAHLFAPVGYYVSLGRCLVTAILLTLAEKAGPLLKPWIGDWYLLAVLLASVLIIQAVLWLPFWRSVFTTIIYAVVVGSVVYFLLGKRPDHRAHHAAPSFSNPLRFVSVSSLNSC